MDHVASKDISKTLKDAATSTDLQQRGFPLSRTYPHSFQVGGTIALKLANINIIMTKNHDQWSLDMLLKHAHEHILSLGDGVSKAMV